MNNKNFIVEIAIPATPQHVFNCIKQVSCWWSKDYAGTTENIGDEFVIHHPGRHFSKQQVVEMAPGKKLVWCVVDSELDWLQYDKHEWTNTKMIFEITTAGDKTVLHFTHEGLTAEKECYERCSQGWSMVITGWLLKFITTGQTI